MTLKRFPDYNLYEWVSNGDYKEAIDLYHTQCVTYHTRFGRVIPNDIAHSLWLQICREYREKCTADAKAD